jgi:hypothetical protein
MSNSVAADFCDLGEGSWHPFFDEDIPPAKKFVRNKKNPPPIPQPQIQAQSPEQSQSKQEIVNSTEDNNPSIWSTLAHGVAKSVIASGAAIGGGALVIASPGIAAMLAAAAASGVAYTLYNWAAS